MKKVSSKVLVILAVILIGCSGSDTYRGSWKATDAKGEKFEIFFDAKNFSVKDSSGKSKKYEYSQNAVNIENSVATYGIQLEDGRGYQINFPNADNESMGIIMDENGNPIYTISRKEYLKYEDIFKL